MNTLTFIGDGLGGLAVVLGGRGWRGGGRVWVPGRGLGGRHPGGGVRGARGRGRGRAGVVRRGVSAGVGRRVSGLEGGLRHWNAEMC